MTPSDQSISYWELGPERPNYVTVRVTAYNDKRRDDEGARPSMVSFDFTWDGEAIGSEGLCSEGIDWLSRMFPDFRISAQIMRNGWRGPR